MNNAQTLDYYKYKEALDLQIRPVVEKHLATVNKIGGKHCICESKTEIVPRNARMVHELQERVGSKFGNLGANFVLEQTY